MTTINQKIKDLIHQLRSNTYRFGMEAGISGTAIGYIIGKKQTKPGYEVLKKLIDRYNINPAYFFFDDVPMFNENKAGRPGTVEVETIFDVNEMNRVMILEADDIRKEFEKIWQRLEKLERASSS